MLLTVNFRDNYTISPVMISDSQVSSLQFFGSITAGEIGYSLTCAAVLVTPVPLPSDVPTPTFQWFFGPNGNDSIPSGVTYLATTSDNDNFLQTYILYSFLD